MKEDLTMKNFKKVLTIFMAVVLMGTMLMGCGKTSKKTAADGTEILTGGGSNLIYIITPSHSNPFFKTEAEAATAKAQELGYEVKSVSHDDDPTKQAELFDTAISEKAAAIICDNAGSDATVAAVQKARDNNIPTFLIDREINEAGIAISQIVAMSYRLLQYQSQDAFLKQN